MEAVVAANAGSAMPYGNDDITRGARDAVRALFEAPEAAVEFVATGSVANALALACLVKPWDGIFCHRVAHVEEDECGAPEFYSNAKLLLVDGDDARMTPAALDAAIREAADRGVQGVQPGAVTLTNITERGTVYTLDKIRALTDVARAHGLPVHLDGARFANACAALDCTPAEMSWKAGVDVVSFGGTKNGCLGVEAVVAFDPALGRELELRRKRAGHLWSKSRFLAAQMLAYATDGLWLEMARSANAASAALAAALKDVPGARLAYEPAGNLIFADLPEETHARAFAAGARYGLHRGHGPSGAGDDGLVRCRLVCDWSKPQAEIDALRAAWLG
jgi:threonine aldolase